MDPSCLALVALLRRLLQYSEPHWIDVVSLDIVRTKWGDGPSPYVHVRLYLVPLVVNDV